MKKSNSNLKDYLYDSMDYIIVLIIVVLVVSIISWRLDILFNSSNTMDNIEFVEKVEDVKQKQNQLAQGEALAKEEKTMERSKPIDLAKTNKDEMEKATRNKGLDKGTSGEKDGKANPKKEDKVDIKINIPQGSDSSKIADILANSGLISDAKQFLDKCEALGLETKLKAGDFNIAKDSSLETVIDEITK